MEPIEEEAYDLFTRGDFSSARERFQDLFVAHSADNSNYVKSAYQFNVASCHAKEGNYDKALDILSQIEAAEDAGLVYSKALYLVQLGKFDQALNCLDRLSVEELTANLAIEQRRELADALVGLVSSIANHKSNYHHTKCKLLERLMPKLKQIIVEQLEDGDFMWRKNFAHVLFIMDTRYRECSQAYHDIMLLSQQDKSSHLPDQASLESLLKADPVLVSNLCVSYILTGQNREAERLIKEIEQEEEDAESRLVVAEDIELSSSLYGLSGSNSVALKSMLLPTTADLKQQAHPINSGDKLSASHLTHINLAIGTLYCVKNNYEFGLTRIFETLEPLEQKLTHFTWSQAKRCILSLLDKHCRQLIHVRDDLFDQIVKFLIQCETHGVQVASTAILAHASNNNQQESQPPAEVCDSVTYEARYLRAILLNVIHD